MKFEGDFDAKLPIDGLAAPHAQLHVDPGSTHAPSDAIIVPDAHLLFTGDFKRSGVDLILSSDDHELVLRDYFKGEKRAALASPDGAHLTGDIVNALTGHVEYSQADGSASAGKVIGHVTKLSGNASAIRNGVSIILNQGDNVEKGDVVQSGSASTLGITFIDGTVFGLSSNARMVLNEMVYDPNGSNNSSLLSLVAGTISFVAGETAKHGDMKIDTPVATMGIRGTAVLVEIDFDVPQSGGPDAKFQVLVEPDGKTGSYILFDKATLAPIATVNQAGQQVNISHGVVSITNAPLSPDVQKLITDVFSLKFTDNTNVNTKTADHFTDSITPQQFGSLKLPDGTTAVPFILNVNTTINAPPPPTLTLPGSGLQHIDGPPIIFASSDSAGERVAVTHSTATDTASGKVNFVDINAGDAPTVKATFNSFTYQNAQHTDVTAKLNAQQLADITAVEVKLAVVPDPGNNNNGSATWTYSVADSAFDFLAAGETLTLTYMARVDNNYAPNDEASFQSFTITVTGTNDVPVITTGPESVAYSGGKTTPGGNLKTVGNAPTTGTLAFTDVDLTDTHTVSTALTGASLSGPGAVTLDMGALDALAPAPMAAFEKALSAMVASDSTGTGSGTINWQLADLPVYLADFIPKSEKLTLTYTVTVTDSQNTTSTQTVTVTIAGTAAAAVVWIATTGSGSTGDWNDPSNWETGTVPTANDDTIIITDQLQNLTPYYPVTINAPAFAKTVTMNDFGSTAPELDNNSSLTIGGTFDLINDAIVNNKSTRTISVGGAMEIVNKSHLVNAGTLNLAQGGDFKDQSSITNSGTLDVNGGRLNVLVNVANTGGTVQVAAAAALALNGAAVDGGTVTNKANGTIDLTGAGILKNGTLSNSGQINVSGAGNALDGETVTNTGAGAIDVTGTLDLENATVNGGTLGGHGSIATATGNNASTLNGVTIASGTTVTAAVGTLDLTGIITNNGEIDAGIGTLDLENVTINGGKLGGSGTIATATGNSASTLNGVTIASGTTVTAAVGTLDLTGIITNNGEIDAGIGTLDLENATVNGGKLGGHGSIATATGNSASTLNGVTIAGGTTVTAAVGTLDLTGIITNNGEIDAGTGTLDLENVTINGGKLGGSGTIATATGNSDSTLNGVTIASGTTVTAAVGTLDLTGIITNNGEIDAGIGTLDLENVTINGGKLGGHGSIATATGNNASTLNGVTIASGTTVTAAVGTLDLTGIITNNGEIDAGTGTLDLENATINGGTLGGHGSIATASGNNASTLNGVSIASGTTVTAAVGTLDLTGIITNNGEIDAGTGTLDLENATINGGKLGGHGSIATATGNSDSTLNGVSIASGTTVTAAVGTLDLTGIITNNGEIDAGTGTLDLENATVNGGTINDHGLIDVTGSSSINGTINGGVITNAVLNNGGVTVASGVTLTLDNVTVNGTAFNDNATGAALSVNSGDTLTLQNGASVTGGSLSNAGTVHIETTSGATLDGVSVDNTGGTIKVDTIQSPSLVTLTLQDSTTITDGTLSIGNIGQVEIASGATAAFDGVIVHNGSGADPDGLIQVDGTLKVSATSISGGTVTDNGTIDVTGDSTIDSNLSLTGGQIEVEDNSTLTLGNALSIGAHTVTLVGANAILDDSAGLSLAGGTIGGLGKLAADTNLSGYGKVSIALDSADHVTANGGTLEFTAAVDNTTATSFDIAAATGSVLKFDAAVGTASVNPTVTFEGADNGAGVLDLTAIALTNFHGVIANFDEGEAIDVHYAASASLDNTGKVLTVFDSSGTSLGTIDLATSYAGDTFNVSNGVITVDDLAVTLDRATATEGTAITVTAVTDDGASVAANVTYSWQTLDSNGHWNEVGSSSSYVPSETDEGQSLRLVTTNAADPSDSESTIINLGTVAENPSENATIALTGLTGGHAVEGQQITASVTEGDAPTGSGASYIYTWSVGGTAVQGDTGNTYTPSESDEGKAISVKVSFTDIHGYAETGTTSAGTVAESPTENATIALAGLTNGHAVESQQITATVTEGDAPTGSGASYTYTWSVDGKTVGDSGNTYTPSESDEGKAISVKVSFTDTHGYTETGSTSAGTVAESPSENATIALAGLINDHAVEGQQITATVTEGDAPTGSGASYTYTWTVGGKTVGDTGNTYTPSESDEGKAICVAVSFTDTHGNTKTGSASAGTVADAPAVPTSFATTFLHFDGGASASGAVATTHVGNGANDGATLEGWANWNGQGNNGDSQLLFYNGSTSDAGFGVNGVVTANGLDLQIQTGGIPGIDTGITLAAGQWHDVALSHVNGIFTLYVDGVAKFTTSENVNGIPGTHQDYTLIGGDAGGGEGFHGSIADVSVWNTALTQAQVQATEFTSLTGSETGLAAYFPLNNGSGTTATDLVNIAGNLTLTGNPVWQTGENATISLNGLDGNNNAVQGQQITATVTDADAPTGSGATYTYTWSVDGKTVGDSGNTYTPTEADEGKAISVAVSFTDSHGNTETGSNSAGAVHEIPSNDLVATLNATGAAEGAQINVIGVTDGGVAVTAGLSYAWQVSSDGHSWTTVSSNSFYAPSGADEGKALQLVTTYIDQPTGNSEQTTNSLGTIADIAPALTAPFSYSVDELKIVKGGSVVFDDTFSQAPPAGSNFGTTPVNFSTIGSTWMDINGKAVMSSSGAVIPPDGGVQVIARLLTNTQDESLSSGGLKESSTFAVSATFDLVTPPFSGDQYGIDLNDATSTHANDEMVELIVARNGSGDATVELVQANYSTSTFNLIASQTLTSAELSGNNQIRLDLSHLTADTSAITGSFELLNSGTQTSAKTFETTGHLFNNVTYTRADIFAFGPKSVAITGVLQDGQTLTAKTSVNDNDATIHYQWQSSSDGTNWSNIGTDSSQYVLREADEGLRVHVVATASDPDNGSTASVTSAASVAVQAEQVTISLNGLTAGNAVEGQQITASINEPDAPQGSGITYTWTVGGHTVQGDTGNTYTPSQADEGQAIGVAVSFNDAHNNHETGSASAGTVAAAAPVANNDAISNASAPTGNGWVLDTDNGHYYRLVTPNGTFGAAVAGAAADGGYLATITSAAEQSFVLNHVIAGNVATWLGGETTNDRPDGTTVNASTWFWVTGPEAGTQFTYSNWNAGEPSGGFGATTQYLIVGADGGWNDAPDAFLPGNGNGAGYVEEWGGLPNQIAFRENAGTTIATSVLLANDTDLDNRTLTVTSVGDQSGHSLHGGGVSLNGNIVSYTPAANYSGADSFSYTISDGSLTSTATVSFNVAQTTTQQMALKVSDAPVIETDQFHIVHHGDGTTTIAGLSVLDADASLTETFTINAVSASGNSVTLSTDSGSLTHHNGELATGITYHPGLTPLATDKITVTVADSSGVTDTVNFIFNEANPPATTPVTLAGTTGKDVIFGTGYGDVLTGGGGQDQFVFAPTLGTTTAQHTITDFVTGLDKIDLRQFNNIASLNDITEAQHGNDTLLTLDSHDTLLLKNVALANLHANDFILHPGSLA